MQERDFFTYKPINNISNWYMIALCYKLLTLFLLFTAFTLLTLPILLTLFKQFLSEKAIMHIH